jgi:hypothetical protein
MPAHTHTQIRKAIFILLLLTTIAWLTFLVADTKSAAPETSPRQSIAASRPVQVPGSSLEGINEPLSAIILWQNTVAQNEAAAKAQAETAARAAAAARATQRSATPSAPVVRSAPTTRCPAEIVDLIHKHWDRFGVDVANWAIGIAWRESNCRPDVTSSTGCAGIFQLWSGHAGLFTAAGFSFHPDAWSAEPNIIVAANLYASSGPGPWRL